MFLLLQLRSHCQHPDYNPSPPKRSRRSCRRTQNVVVSKWQVGRKVKMPAWRFGEDWAMREFGERKYKAKVMLGTIVSGAGRYKWNVRWEYDGETTMRPQKELRVAESF